jgi:small subunit ribosomal protein S20
MATHKSAKKRIRSSERKKEVNKRIESKIKTLIKKVYSTDKKEDAEKSYKEAIAYLDKSATKGKIHKNNAARKKASLTRHLNQLPAAK